MYQNLAVSLARQGLAWISAAGVTAGFYDGDTALAIVAAGTGIVSGIWSWYAAKSRSKLEHEAGATLKVK